MSVQPLNLPIKRVLIANRGEIAVRIIRSLRELGIESVAVYSDADEYSMHRELADFAIRLPGRSSAETYLNQKLLFSALDASSADAVHPGYGFLSENQKFAQGVLDAKKIFIGPTPQSMDAMGDKISAKRLMQAHNVPTVPGSDGELASLESLEALVKEIGFPIIIKASGGGGGRGMRVVREVSALKDAYDSCRREAEAYFGNSTVFCERYIDKPRHIEIQVLFDRHGNGVHLFERDCSIQRRHQKLFEEAPSAYLNHEQRNRLGEIAVRAGLATNYNGAGTVEFICESPERAYFMEMNTRIQVEHPVTEMITGIDLIRWQILVAAGVPLAFKQSDIQLRGWAMEARINAEIPEQNFMPAVGTIETLHVPAGPFVRFDSHIYTGYKVPSEYDSMIAKLIVWGDNREEARMRLDRSLRELRTAGLATTASFHRRLINHPDFQNAELYTTWLENHIEDLVSGPASLEKDASQSEMMAAAILHWQRQQSSSVNQKTSDPLPRWRARAQSEGLRPARLS
jgi:acetyl-CoA carboxylase biotin carboxylase subunit